FSDFRVSWLGLSLWDCSSFLGGKSVVERNRLPERHMIPVLTDNSGIQLFGLVAARGCLRFMTGRLHQGVRAHVLGDSGQTDARWDILHHHRARPAWNDHLRNGCRPAVAAIGVLTRYPETIRIVGIGDRAGIVTPAAHCVMRRILIRRVARLIEERSA